MLSACSCARPGCGVSATAWLTYDYRAGTVWLSDIGSSGDGNRWALCSAHAERLSVPRGWVRVDQRAGAEQVADRTEVTGAGQTDLGGTDLGETGDDAGPAVAQRSATPPAGPVRTKPARRTRGKGGQAA